jgi:hypothetical protein
MNLNRVAAPIEPCFMPAIPGLVKIPKAHSSVLSCSPHHRISDPGRAAKPPGSRPALYYGGSADPSPNPQPTRPAQSYGTALFFTHALATSHRGNENYSRQGERPPWELLASQQRGYGDRPLLSLRPAAILHPGHPAPRASGPPVDRIAGEDLRATCSPNL